MTKTRVIPVQPAMPLASAVRDELEKQVPLTQHRERVKTALSGEQSRIILVDSLDFGIRVVNAYAPEHLELHVRNIDAALSGVKNAGVIFIGSYTPVAVGDYIGGSNHVLPTGGTARFASGLSTQTFMRAQQVVTYDSGALQHIVAPLSALAEAEELPAHAESVQIRFEE